MNPDPATLRVVLADDHHISRAGLRGTLEAEGISVVAEATDGDEAVELVAAHAPDVLVTDLRMPGSSLADTLRRVRGANPAVRLVVLTVSADERDVQAAIAAGADSYLLKDTLAEQLVRAIRETAAGACVLSAEAMAALAAGLRHPNRLAGDGGPGSASAPLSARELDVLRLIVEGQDNAAIGRDLSISRHTVKRHVTNIFEKLGVGSRVEAAVRAVRDRLV